MTEEEAKEKRCCGPEGCGREDAFRVRWCIGSQCMAWRREVTPENTGDNPYEIVAATVRQSGGLVQEMPKAQQEVPSGHCGLAGKP